MPAKETPEAAAEHTPKPKAEPSAYRRDLVSTFLLIIERDVGCTTPVESFIRTLVAQYGAFEENGRGLPLEFIEQEMAELRDIMPEAIEEAHFLASRYPLEEQSTPAALTEEPETAPVK